MLIFFVFTDLLNLILKVVSVDELRDDAEYKEIVEDMREESEKFGKFRFTASNSSMQSMHCSCFVFILLIF